MMRLNILHTLLVIIIFLTAGTVAAREILNETDCIVPEDTVIEGNLFVVCETLTIDGEVQGDVIGIAVRTMIEGDVDGNIYLISAQLDIWGQVSEDVHFGGAVLRLNPPHPDELLPLEPQEALTPATRVRGSIKAVALSAELFEGSRVTDGIIQLGYQLIIQGVVDDEINFWGSLLQIDGRVIGDIFAAVGDPNSESSNLQALLIPLNLDLNLRNPGLLLAEDGTIIGSLNYRGPTAAMIDGVVNDEIIYYPLIVNPLPTLEEPRSFARYASQFGREFITLVLIGAAGLFLFPNLVNLPLTNLRTRPFANFSVGMLAFILSFPVVLIGLLLSLSVLFVLQLIGLQSLVIAVSIVLGLINFGGMSIFYFVAIFVARSLVGLAIGRLLMRIILNTRVLSSTTEYIALAVGMLILSIVVSLPFIGWLFNAAALFLGLGTILTVLLDQFRKIRDSAVMPAPAWYAPSPAVTRPRTPMTNVPVIDVLPVEDDDDDTILSRDPTNQALPSPRPIKSERPPVHGVQNLPDGFDMSFFEDDGS